MVEGKWKECLVDIGRGVKGKAEYEEEGGERGDEGTASVFEEASTTMKIG